MNSQGKQKISLTEFARLTTYPLASSIACRLIRAPLYVQELTLLGAMDTPEGWERRMRFSFKQLIPDVSFDAVEGQGLQDEQDRLTRMYLIYGITPKAKLDN